MARSRSSSFLSSVCLLLCFVLLCATDEKSSKSSRQRLDNVAKCMNATFHYRMHSENVLFTHNTTIVKTDKLPVEKFSTFFVENILTSIPPFDLTVTPKISEPCRRQGRQYLTALNNLTFWALQMYDASAKMPSGILRGNINQLGDFDQCLSIREAEIKGQYCLAYVQVKRPKLLPLAEKLHRLIHAHYILTSQLDDPGHRVPRFSNLQWALCVPAVCTAKDVQTALRYSLRPLVEDAGLNLEIQVNHEMCQTKSDSIPLSTIIGSGFFLVAIFFAIFATFYDLKQPKNPNQFLLAFSLRLNTQKLFSLDRPGGDIASVHGIRCFNALMLLLSHKSMAVFYSPYVNRTAMSEQLGQPWTVVARASSLYTDPFIMFSGMLTAYSLFGRLKRAQSVNVIQEYISRLFRLIPTLGALIMFCTLILPWLGSGPQWNLVVTHHSDICKKYWWRNLMFIHNYFGFDKMCLTHTHHIGIDTQLFFASPLFVWIVWKWQRRGILALVLLASVSTIMRYYVTYSMRLNNYVHYGTSIKQLFQTADNMYILPAYRATVYLMGIILGYFLRSAKTISLNKYQIIFGDLFAFTLFGAAFIGPSFMGKMEYKYNPLDAAWYAAFAPIAWCLSFAWIVFKNHFGYSDVFGRLFSWKGFLVSTRLSYALYLTQFPIFFFNVGQVRHSEFYSFITVMFTLKEYFMIAVVSMVLTLLFDTPFQNVKNIWFRKQVRKEQEDQVVTVKKFE